MPKGYIHVYTGDGKGKTTAALGLCLRAWGHGQRVAVVQFIKGRCCGEHLALKKLDIPVLQCPSNTKKQWERAQSMLREGAYDLLIWDEIMAAINRGSIELKQVVRTMAEKPEPLELVLTGRGAPEEIIRLADLVTKMEPIKHYFNMGVTARIGVEF
ncbi:MAG: cob(I)yrinic acid a,c-diamide adenosyltransferase [Firmicutes bacterium]|nr:cob(I)yrinic acid a,c-diamide adenosyltransferase [Bacillota bacterium]